jgi:flagellin
MTSINTNVSALIANKNMQEQTAKMGDAMERLSSGLRINSAADDAAGSAIASKMESQVRSLGVAIRNSYDAISMTQTAEGALGEMENILQRVRELSVQAGNSTLSTVDRSMIQSEVDALLTEVDSISKNTNFNGVNLLDGAKSSVSFQIGINASDSLAVKLESSDTVALGLNGSKGVSTLTSERVSKTDYSSATLAKADVKINGFNALSSDFSTNLSSDSNAALTIATAINSNTGVHGAQADAFNNVTTVGKGTFAQSATFTINANTVALATSYSSLVDNINESVSGVVAVLNADNTIGLSNKTGAEIVIAEVSTGTGAADVGFTAGTYTGMISLENTDGTAVKIEAGNSSNGYASTSSVIGKGTIADVNGLGFNENSSGSTVESAVVSGSALAADELKLNDVLIGPSDNGSAQSIAAAINTKTAEHGVTANAKTEASLKLNTSSIPSQMSINGNNVSLSSAIDTADVVTAINNAGIGDVRASTDSNGLLKLESASGVDIKVSHNTSNDFIEQYTDINGTVSDFGIQKGISDRDYVVAAATINTTATLTAAVTSATNLNSLVTITETAAANSQTGVVYTITGTDMDGNAQTENITGPIVSGTAIGEKVFKTITAVVTDGTTTGNVSVGLSKATTDIDSLVTSTDIGAAGTYTLNGSLTNNNDLDAFVLLSSAANESGNSFTITGTDTSGNALTEIIAGGNLTPVQTANRFGSVTSISTNANSGIVQIGTTRDFAALTAANETFSLTGLMASTDIGAAGAYTITTGGMDDHTDMGAVVSVVAAGTAGNFTITGTDMNGQAQIEVIAATATATTVGTKIFKTITAASVDADAGAVTLGLTSVHDSFAVKGNLSLSTDKNSTIKIDSVAADTTTAMTANSGGVEASLQKLGLQKQGQSFEVTGKGIDVSTEAGAAFALKSIDDAIAKVSGFRSSFGAVENRIDASINNLTTLKINTEAAQSRIQDADFASETSSMTKAQILSQAATSMLAQANASKQNLLALLQG